MNRISTNTLSYEILSEHYIDMANQCARLAENNNAAQGIHIDDVAYYEALAEHCWSTAVGGESDLGSNFLGRYICSLDL